MGRGLKKSTTKRSIKPLVINLTTLFVFMCMSSKMNIKQVKVMKREENQLQIINGKEQRTETDPPPPFLQLLIENRKPKCRVRRPVKNSKSFPLQPVTYIAIARAGSTTLREGFSHHCHDCTVNDMEQRGFRYVLVPLRHPLARISSGLSRRFEGWKTEKESNGIIHNIFHNSTNGEDAFLTSLRSETDPYHKDVIRSILGPKNQNYMVPITHFYLKNYTGVANIAFLCIETLLDDYHAAFRRWGLKPHKNLTEESIRNKSPSIMQTVAVLFDDSSREVTKSVIG